MRRWAFLALALAGCGGEPIEGKWANRHGLKISVEGCEDHACGGTGSASWLGGECSLAVDVSIRRDVDKSASSPVSNGSFEFYVVDVTAPDGCDWKWGEPRSGASYGVVCDVTGDTMDCKGCAGRLADACNFSRL